MSIANRQKRAKPTNFDTTKLIQFPVSTLLAARNSGIVWSVGSPVRFKNLRRHYWGIVGFDSITEFHKNSDRYLRQLHNGWISLGLVRCIICLDEGWQFIICLSRHKAWAIQYSLVTTLSTRNKSVDAADNSMNSRTIQLTSVRFDYFWKKDQHKLEYYQIKASPRIIWQLAM
jgi:hypothetical protein